MLVTTMSNMLSVSVEKIFKEVKIDYVGSFCVTVKSIYWMFCHTLVVPALRMQEGQCKCKGSLLDMVNSRRAKATYKTVDTHTQINKYTHKCTNK